VGSCSALCDQQQSTETVHLDRSFVQNPGGDEQRYEPKQSLRAHPVWQVYETGNAKSGPIVRLVGMQALCTPVHLLRRYMDLSELLEAAVRDGDARSPSSEMVFEFAQAFDGAEGGEGIEMARAAAIDALLCAGAMYSLNAPAAQPVRRWSIEHVQEYAVWAW